MIRFLSHVAPTDLVDTVPALTRLKACNPSYIRRAEAALKTGRDFAERVMLPRVLDIDSRCTDDPRYFDWELWRRANSEKLTVALIPEKMGGLGYTALGATILCEEMTSACMGMTANILFNNFGLLGALVEFRTGILMRVISDMIEAQRAERPLFWAWAITEPSAGTDVEDAQAMRTMRPSTWAEKVKGGYLINGTKCFITNGSLAHYVIATIPTDRAAPLESMATFLIPADSKGYAVGKVERKCGQKASQTAELIFENLFVPEENCWEPPGRGLRHTREILSTTRGFIGAAALGVARGAFERCVGFAAGVSVRGHRLIEEDWVQIALADMLKDIKTVRAACYNFAVSVDTLHVMRLFENLPVRALLRIVPESFLMANTVKKLAGSAIIENMAARLKQSLVSDERVEDFVKEGSAVKVAGTDLATRISVRVLDIAGIEGMSYRYGLEKSYRDAKITQIYEGTNQANRIDLFHGDIYGRLGSLFVKEGRPVGT
ncbi:MAG: acyl-CoA dehydrogenase family protein [Deltaproteobacteria bacterium]|nr:acyl-CoA dehydrogenase family protein [Deltaproteobacteria bacterium]